MSKNRNKKSVTTGVPKNQDATASVPKKSKKDISMKRYKLVIWLVLTCVLGMLLGGFFIYHQSQKVLEKHDEINLHDKEEIYKRNLDLQLKAIEDLKEYKEYLLDNNDEDIVSTYEIDGLIAGYICDFKYEEDYQEIMPEEFDYYRFPDLNFEGRFEKYLCKLEELAEKFSYSVGVNTSIKKELSNKKEKIEKKVKDTKLLNRAWKLEATCSNNLEKIDDIKLAD